MPPKLLLLNLLVILSSIEPIYTSSIQKRDTQQQKIESFRQNCHPKGSGNGCTCTVTDKSGKETTVQFNNDDECKKPIKQETVSENKKNLNAEFKEKYGGLKENCFPRPGRGCRCIEKDTDGNEVERRYELESDCKAPLRMRRANDPVREQAARNYAAVIDELKNKFKGLKEGCYPRPKGCLCVIGKDQDGRDIVERRMKDSDCKCQVGEKGSGCPAQGA